MKPKRNNYAYIDGANLHKGIDSLGWKLDYARFRVWLTEKYGVTRAYLFIGLIPKYKELYVYLQEAGFVLIFKETVYDGEEKIKGNCDADLVLHSVKDVFESDAEQLVIVSSDGDYAGMVNFLHERKKLRIILSPHRKEQCSVLLKRTNTPITYLDGVRGFIEKRKEKAPGVDKTAQGSLS
ncbi:MAG: NYN domain-containing protein [Candidatus Parcubacteria bacterium]|nr:NYN domain-containing protein [Candidatus Parcubacteria bacterium]